MRKRTLSRETALRMLYQNELNTGRFKYKAPHLPEPDEEEKLSAGDTDEYAVRLMEGYLKNKNYLDKLISDVLKHWDMARLGAIDRAILRLAAYELIYCPDVPPAVVINEAVELAKKYADKESAAFINGVLDQINKQKK